MKNGIPNLAKACQALKLVADAPEGLTMADVEEGVGASQTTTFRLLNTLVAEGLLEKRGRAYHLGPELVRLGLEALGRVTLREGAVPVLAALAEATGETAHVAIPSGEASLILEVCESPNPIRAASRPGTLAALHCSSTGKVFLAGRAEEGAELRRVLTSLRRERRTGRTLTRVEELESEIARIRRQGYAIDDGEYHEGVRCLAAPVRDPSGQVVAAIGITAAAARFARARDAEVAREVIAAAARLEAALGGRPEVAA